MRALVVSKTGALVGVSQRPSPNRGGALKAPTLLVYHFTAGRGFNASLNWLRNPTAKASAHLVVGRAGELAQLVPLNRVAWHAGASSWKGRSSVNSFSIGIEIDNFGPLTLFEGRAYPWFAFARKVRPLRPLAGAQAVPDADVVPVEGRPWHAYTELQLERLDEVTRAVLVALPSIVDMAGHEHVRPGKEDPGPLFPWERYRKRLLERSPSTVS